MDKFKELAKKIKELEKRNIVIHFKTPFSGRLGILTHGYIPLIIEHSDSFEDIEKKVVEVIKKADERDYEVNDFDQLLTAYNELK